MLEILDIRQLFVLWLLGVVLFFAVVITTSFFREGDSRVGPTITWFFLFIVSFVVLPLCIKWEFKGAPILELQERVVYEIPQNIKEGTGVFVDEMDNVFIYLSKVTPAKDAPFKGEPKLYKIERSMFRSYEPEKIFHGEPMKVSELPRYFSVVMVKTRLYNKPYEELYVVTAVSEKEVFLP